MAMAHGHTLDITSFDAKLPRKYTAIHSHTRANTNMDLENMLGKAMLEALCGAEPRVTTSCIYDWVELWGSRVELLRSRLVQTSPLP